MLLKTLFLSGAVAAFSIASDNFEDPEGNCHEGACVGLGMVEDLGISLTASQAEAVYDDWYQQCMEAGK